MTRAYSQHQSGLITDDFFEQMRAGAATALATPAFRTAWEKTYRVPGTKFAAFMDGLAAHLSAAEP